MRITAKIMQNNSLSNINTNKTLQDKLNTQMATEKKINRPSDDPVIAIRALRLRTNVSQVTQYYEKNVPDADSWLQITEDALSTVSEVVTDMIDQCTKGANEKLTSTDRITILDALKSLRDEVYATGNADYAGRSVFTGYRTDSTLKFVADEQKTYSITEHITTAKIDALTHVKTADLNGINEVNYNDTQYSQVNEQKVGPETVYRIRLAYRDVDGLDTTTPGTDKDGNPTTGIPAIKYYDPTNADADDNGYVGLGNTIEVVSIKDGNNPYDRMATNQDGILLVKETGELLIGSNVYESLMSHKDNENTVFDESSLLITYEKTNWEKDDLKPEHYFTCTDKSDPDTAKHVTYNSAYIVPGEKVEKQVIEYDIGMNQTIQVNTTADEVFIHDIGRDVDDLVRAMQDVVDMEATVAKLTGMVEDDKYSETERNAIQERLDAANKALTYLSEKAQKMFEGGITKMQGHLDTVNLAVTNCGTRGQKLELIEKRLMSQKTNFENLESENENVDITDVAIKLSSAELTYEAALMATGKIMQTSLMNYI